MRRSLAVGTLVAAAMGLAGCTAGAESEPEDSIDRSATGGVSASGTAPIVFAFVCAVGSSDRTETYTTYSAAWEDDRTDCRAQRITGTELSSQQRAAVQAAAGDATLEQLAAGCAVQRTGPWVGTVDSVTEAHVAAGLLEYCPGHPETDHLQDAVAGWRS